RLTGRALVLDVSWHGDAPRQALNRAAGRRLGDVLAPQWLLVHRPAPELFAIADPLNTVVFEEDDLHGAGGKSVGAQDRHGGLGLAASAQSQCHEASIIRVGCGLSVDYL